MFAPGQIKETENQRNIVEYVSKHTPIYNIYKVQYVK